MILFTELKTNNPKILMKYEIFQIGKGILSKK